MEKILTNVHLIIILVAAFFAWEKYDEHTQRMEMLEGRVPVLQNSIASSKRQLKSLQKYYKDIEAAKKRIEVVALEVEKRQKQFPNEISDPKNLQLFSDAAKELNMKDVYLNPEREDIQGFYITKEYALKASGTFLQFLIFLEKIEAQTQLFNIKSIEFTQTNKRQKGRYQLINGDIKILAYKYNSGYREDRGFDKIEEDFKKEQEQQRAEQRKKNKQKKKGGK